MTGQDIAAQASQRQPPEGSQRTRYPLGQRQRHHIHGHRHQRHPQQPTHRGQQPGDQIIPGRREDVGQRCRKGSGLRPLDLDRQPEGRHQKQAQRTDQQACRHRYPHQHEAGGHHHHQRRQCLQQCRPPACHIRQAVPPRHSDFAYFAGVTAQCHHRPTKSPGRQAPQKSHRDQHRQGWHQRGQQRPYQQHRQQQWGERVTQVPVQLSPQRPTLTLRGALQLLVAEQTTGLCQATFPALHTLLTQVQSIMAAIP